MIAALPMYAAPEPIAKANERLIAEVMRRFDITRQPAPSDLYQLWLHPQLLFAQTCGYPLVTRLRNRVKVLCRPDYVLDALPASDRVPHPAMHRSVIVVRKDDARRTMGAYRDAHAVINAYDSNTGMNLFRHHLCALACRGRFFARVAVSGSHRQSMRQVAAGSADVAAIDEVTWRNYRRFAPSVLAGLRVLETTVAVPTLPLIASIQTSQVRCEAIVNGLNDALAAVPEIAETLGLRSFVQTALVDYDVLGHYERYATARGYPKLA